MVIHPYQLCRFLEPRGRHQAFRVPGRDHRRPVLLLLLLPAQHRLCGDGRRQPQEKPHVGHREPATVRECAGWSGGGSGRRRHQAAGSVPHEPAVKFFRFLFEKRLRGDSLELMFFKGLKDTRNQERARLERHEEALSDCIKCNVQKKLKNMC